jgi:hypothetical protein
MDDITHFMDNFVKCISFLMECSEVFGNRDRLPLEFFELYVILIPFYYFGSALKSGACARPDIVACPTND